MSDQAKIHPLLTDRGEGGADDRVYVMEYADGRLYFCTKLGSFPVTPAQLSTMARGLPKVVVDVIAARRAFATPDRSTP